MSDIKKTALVILIIALLSNTFTQYAYAADSYDHDELMQYEGYGKAMYESVVEQTTFLTGQYADNKDYVRDSMNEIKSYSDFWYNEYNDFTSSCYQSSAMNCLGEMAERGGAYVLTVGDWIKNLFNDYEENINPSDAIPKHPLSSYFVADGVSSIKIVQGYYYKIGSTKYGESMSLGSNKANYPNEYTFSMHFSANGFSKNLPVTKHATPEERDAVRDAYLAKGRNPDFMLGIASEGGPISIHRYGNDELISDGGGGVPPRTINPITKYINENTAPTVVVPQLKPRLVCPDGTVIQMSVNGSTFLSVDGTVMLVNKDGTAEVNGSLCNLGWTKPTVGYDPVTDKPVVTQPDGTKTDLETGDSQIKPPGSNDLEGCTGVLCGIGKLLDGVGSVVKAIGDLVKKLLDGLLGLFVPDDLDFVTEEFNKITKKLNDKIAITDSLKEAITSVFDGGGSNPLANISINLPITNEPLTFGNVSFIEEGVPILRRVISAIVVLYTIAYVYRKITGRGGVMER